MMCQSYFWDDSPKLTMIGTTETTEPEKDFIGFFEKDLVGFQQ